MSIVEASLEHYKDFASRMEREFRDYHFQACLSGDDGQNYYLTYSLARMENRDFAKLVISIEPIWFMTTPAARIIQKGEKPEIELGENKPYGAMETKFSSSEFSVKVESFEVIAAPPMFKLRCEENGTGVDLALKSLGLPFWFNEGKEEGGRITPSSGAQWGWELFGTMEGTITIKGKKISVKGYGVHEHLVMRHVAWGEIGWQDWMWFVFDDLYGLIFNIHGGGYQDGGIYLMKDKEYVVTRDYDIDHPEWAYSPFLQHHVPSKLKVRARNEKGTLHLEGDIVRILPWRRINKYRHAVSVPCADTEFQWQGRFVYKDGQTLTLNNGKGGNEVIGNFNFVQSLM